MLTLEPKDPAQRQAFGVVQNLKAAERLAGAALLWLCGAFYGLQVLKQQTATELDAVDTQNEDAIDTGSAQADFGCFAPFQMVMTTLLGLIFSILGLVIIKQGGKLCKYKSTLQIGMLLMIYLALKISPITPSSEFCFNQRHQSLCETSCAFQVQLSAHRMRQLSMSDYVQQYSSSEVGSDSVRFSDHEKCLQECDDMRIFEKHQSEDDFEGRNSIYLFTFSFQLVITVLTSINFKVDRFVGLFAILILSAALSLDINQNPVLSKELSISFDSGAKHMVYYLIWVVLVFIFIHVARLIDVFRSLDAVRASLKLKFLESDLVSEGEGLVFISKGKNPHISQINKKAQDVFSITGEEAQEALLGLLLRPVSSTGRYHAASDFSNSEKQVTFPEAVQMSLTAGGCLFELKQDPRELKGATSQALKRNLSDRTTLSSSVYSSPAKITRLARQLELRVQEVETSCGPYYCVRVIDITDSNLEKETAAKNYQLLDSIIPRIKDMKKEFEHLGASVQKLSLQSKFDKLKNAVSNSQLESSVISLSLGFNSILDVYEIEQGGFNLNNGVFCIKEAVNKVFQTLEKESSRNLVKITSSIDREVPNQVLCDKIRLQQVLLTLLQIILRYSSDGTLSVVLSYLKRQNRQKLVFQLSSKFENCENHEIFDQLKKLSSAHKGDLGVGMRHLSFIKDLVQKMKGTITVQAEPGRGAFIEFCVEDLGISDKPSSVNTLRQSQIRSGLASFVGQVSPIKYEINHGGEPQSGTTKILNKKRLSAHIGACQKPSKLQKMFKLKPSEHAMQQQQSRISLKRKSNRSSFSNQYLNDEINDFQSQCDSPPPHNRE